ncbi:MAG: site-specific DNA-methyltransferase [Caldilineaceae bacterium]|nr:site-specific DNA-methyltransferase [Caldilineaceae bacterium]
MAPAKKTKKEITSYAHTDEQRVNNPPVGLVTPETDKDGVRNRYAYDPHLDPQLVWAGKTEHTSFEVPTVSLHVHERIDPRTIVEAVRRQNGVVEDQQLSLFSLPEENPPLRHAVEFYQHEHNWSNRMIAGDSLLVMNSLIEKEGMADKVQMIYIDPPYGIKYGSNFQPFVNKHKVKDGKDDDLTSEPEQIRAFRDTWELGIHSYLDYLRDRLHLAREMLTSSGSCFVQISDENVHLVRSLMDEVFGAGNFVSLINYATTSGLGNKHLETTGDYLIWYSKDIGQLKTRPFWLEKELKPNNAYRYIELEDGSRRSLSKDEREGRVALPRRCRVYRYDNLRSQSGGQSGQFPIIFEGQTFRINTGSWKTNKAGMKALIGSRRIGVAGNTLCYIRYIDDFPCKRLTNMWTDTTIAGFASNKRYVVETNQKVIQRCVLMTTDPGDLVFDPTCGSGTTAYVAEQWGRRWITCDTSRVALTLARQRLITASFDYFALAHPEEGVGSGFKCKTVPHVTLRSIANNPDIREGMTRAQIDAAVARHAPQETLYDQPIVDSTKKRVTGPFTTEAVPAPAVRSVDDLLENGPQPVDASIARGGETLRQSDWRDELLKTGIRGKAGQRIRFARLEPLPGTRYLHALGETLPNTEGAEGFRENGAAAAAQHIVVSFGPEHAPLEQRQVAQAIEEALTLAPKPKVVVFAAFQFDPEAAKDIDETNWTGVTLLKAQMNADLLTDDLKKKSSSNESFWMIGQPDVELEEICEGENQGKYRVSVHGFDYYNTKTGNVESGGQDKIAVWMLDTDYDGRSVFPQQVFFPMAGQKDGWARLAKNLKAEVDEDLIEAYRGTVSLPFALGDYLRIAVKIVDDRGIESLKVLDVE